MLTGYWPARRAGVDQRGRLRAGMELVARGAVLLHETSAESVRLVLDRLQKALTVSMAENRWAVTFSIGAVTFRTPLASAEGMVSEADKVMYSAKAGGKNRIVHMEFK
jgi:diguanylate cyclase (GGDEF)-like protein